MKKKIKIELILLVFTALLLYSSSLTTRTVAQAESIDITSHGCTACNQETNTFWVDWSYTGSIPYVSIYYYNLTMTTIEYTVVVMASNLGTYEWNMPISHPLDGEYYLVVCDYSNNAIRDSVLTEVYPIQTYGPNIPGFSIMLIGLIIGITSVIMTIPLTEKLRKR